MQIDGGTFDQRQSVVAELARFDGAVGLGRVQLRRIEIGTLSHSDPGGTAVGAYHRWNEVVILDKGSSPALLAVYLRHELCHALDHQEGDLSEAQHDSLVELSELVIPGELGDNLNSLELQQETFATICESGPEVPDLATGLCGPTPPRTRALSAWMSQSVWSSWDGWPFQSHTAGPTLRSSVDLGVHGDPPLDGLYIDALMVGNVPAMQFTLSGDGIGWVGPMVDPYSAATVEGSTVTVEPMSTEESTVFGLPLAVHRANSVAVAVVGPEVPYFGGGYRILIGAEEGGWAPVDACPEGYIWQVTVLDGSAWLAWTEPFGVVAWRGVPWVYAEF